MSNIPSCLVSTGTAKALPLLIEGESLFSDGASYIVFDAFKDFATDLKPFDGMGHFYHTDSVVIESIL